MNIVQTLRSLILLSFMSLPMMIIAFVMFLALGLGNMSMFILLIGQVLAVPPTVTLLQAIVGAISKGTNPATFYVPMSDVSLLVPSEMTLDAYANVTPSWWMAHVMFFLGYLLANAVSVYNMPTDGALKAGTEWMAENRRAKAIGIICVVLLTAVTAGIIRLKVTQAETPVGLLVAILAMGGLGYGWYQFAAWCGARQADVFGMVQQMLPADPNNEVPMTCVYAPKP